jgi:hypothetical protein
MGVPTVPLQKMFSPLLLGGTIKLYLPEMLPI